MSILRRLVVVFIISLVSTISFGRSGNLNLGNLVWNDIDGDGKKDPNEPIIAGIVVSLYNDIDNDNLPDGPAIRTSVTDSTGRYQFVNLTDGRYIISIPIIPGYSQGKSIATSYNPDNDVDNDNNGVRSAGGIYFSNAITLLENTEPSTDGDGSNGNQTFDISLCGTGAIGDHVWHDANCNGLQDAGENGIDGVLVTLTYPDGTTATELTHTYLGVSGYYDFLALGPGSYKVTFATPTGYYPAPSNAGGNDATDSDPIGGDVFVNLAPNVSDFTIDAGFCAGTGNLVLGNLVWNDIDGDGRKDPNEYGIAGVTVSLYTDNDNDNLPDGPAIRTTNTDYSGLYQFTGLASGNYIISISIIPGFSQGKTISPTYDPDNDVDDDNNGVRSSGGQYYTNAITLQAGTEPTNDGDGADGNQTLDISLCGQGAIGDFVWQDLNCNGIQDLGEPGINGVPVTITYPDGTTANEITHTFNGVDGYYDFLALGPGQFPISFPSITGSNPTTANAGTDDTKDSDPVNGQVVVTLAPNESNFTIDAGYCQNGNLTLGNLVWNDSDGDGIKDPNEYALSDVQVSLYTDNNSDNLPDGPAIRTTVTGLDGKYLFTNLPAGRYIISIPILPGYNAGGKATTSYNPDNDVDNDNNGVNKVNGVLYSNAITLSPGTEPTNDGDGADGNLTFDIALCGNGAIGDFIWFDANANGIQDAGEQGINGVTVELVAPDGTVRTVVTHTYNGHDGYYDFINLGVGTFTVRFITPAGYNPSPANVGNDRSIDSDPVNGTTTVTLQANESNFTIDAGYYQGGNLRLGNFVWNDSDGDGRKDPNEYGIAGAPISLYTDNDGDNLPDGPAIATTYSDNNGYYLFTNLAPGRYIASMPILPGFQQSPNTSTQNTSPYPDNDVDNDNNLVRRVGPNAPGGILYTNAITLTANGEPTTDGDDANGNLTFDLAQCGNGAIGDFVWNDLNCNGIQDAGEPGINGATVSLIAPDGTVRTVLTHNYNNEDGYYDFINLGPGTFRVVFTTPSGFNPSPSNVGNDDTRDSDPVGDIVTVTLAANQSDFTIDAGYCSGGGLRLGNLVWNDINGDGIRDANEPGVNGATVNLYRDTNGDNTPDGPAIATTVTSNGYYGFSGLSPDKYIVGVVLPAGYIAATATASGANPDNDVDNDNNAVNLAGNEVRTNFITLAAGTEPTNDGDDSNGNLTLDLALQGTGIIGDFVWNDANANGLQEASEVGINNVTVKLVFPDGTVRNTTTNILGKYSFSNLGPGTYLVQFVTPIGMTPSPANVSSNDAKDSDPVNGDVTVTLAANEVNLTIDAGFFKSPCVAAAGTCGPGYLTQQTSLIRNGDFSSPIVTAPMAFVGDYTTPGVAYNFGFGSFTAQAGYQGRNIKPTGERGFSIIDTTGAFVASDSVNQLPFPGDPANSVPASNSFLYHNGNDLGGYAVVWQQNVTGLVLGRNYRFRFYATNMVEPNANLVNPEIRVFVEGSDGVADGTQVVGPVVIDEVTSSNSTALNGWKRIEYSFTATSVSMTFKIVNSQQGIYGNDLGITAIGIEVCEKDTDGDCVADIDDIDDDNDGILDVVESSGYDPLADCDNDGTPNYKDPTPGCSVPAGNDYYGQPFGPIVWTDCNNDGINDFFDWDRDGIINELDLDSDNDGILDVQETRDRKATDNNRDGMVDGIDNDRDGLLSTADANENDPSITASIGLIPQDLDRDGHPNYLDLDSDGDGLVDHREALELDAAAANYSGLTMGTNDDDKDGVRTVSYSNNDNDADNYRGFGAKGIILRDNDNDGYPNPYDIDQDDDGITDNVEGQPTCSEVQPYGTDSDGDGLDDAYDTDNNTCVRKAPGITPYDKEFDGIPDIRDLDTDNDGAPDINEGSGKSGNFVTNFNDSDGDGLIDQFDIFDLRTETTLLQNNVVHSKMGLNGSFSGPIPGGSNAQLPQQDPGTCPNADRDWRNVSILPVKLLEFRGALTSTKVAKLMWKVDNEINMSHYIVERSFNGSDFKEVGKVNAAANSSLTNTYTFDDNLAGLAEGKVYYRLKQVDKGMHFNRTNIITFTINDKAGFNISVYPNPAKNFFMLKVNALKEAQATIRVMDLAGRSISSSSAIVANGTNVLSIDISRLSAGTYTVQVLVDGEVYNQKLIVGN